MLIIVFKLERKSVIATIASFMVTKIPLLFHNFQHEEKFCGFQGSTFRLFNTSPALNFHNCVYTVKCTTGQLKMFGILKATEYFFMPKVVGKKSEKVRKKCLNVLMFKGVS